MFQSIRHWFYDRLGRWFFGDAMIHHRYMRWCADTYTDVPWAKLERIAFYLRKIDAAADRIDIKLKEK